MVKFFLENLKTFCANTTILGTPCDKNGDDLPTGIPPPPRPQKGNDDWAPFTSRVAFELADKLYWRDQASNASVDELFELWSADNLTHGHTAPFIDHNDMFNSIDSIPTGDVSWESFDVSYEGEGNIPEDVPDWMQEKSRVWYRNPHEVVRNLIANPDFKGEFDYAPYCQFRNEKREWTDLMSANWAWRQAVSILSLLPYVWLTKTTGPHCRGE